MAYFGRKPKKPGSTPGAASGFVQREGARRVQRAVLRAVDEGRPARPTRLTRVLRTARAIRAGRNAR